MIQSKSNPTDGNPKSILLSNQPPRNPVLVAVRGPAAISLRASDLAVSAAALFACSAAARPCCGRCSATLFAHLDDIYEWGAAALARSGGTFAYRGMWGGGSLGVVTAVPTNVEHMLRVAELLSEGIFNAGGEAWHAQRRATTVEMHSAQFVTYSSGTIDQLVHGSLLPLRDAGDAVDLQEVLLRFTLDNICAAAFGADAECLTVARGGLPDVPFERTTELLLARFVAAPGNHGYAVLIQ
ncbi:hypothetical protein ACP70R_039699 [Stipagrostis hirtigluma subsp. patula]